MCSQTLKKSTTASISASKAGHSNYQLTPQQIHQFHAEGFLIIPNLLTRNEIDPLIQVCNADPTISGTNSFMDFGQGLPCRVSFWTDLDNSYLGVLPRLTRIVDSVEALLGESCYHWHSKIVLKKPQEGYVVWHQDYATWYEDGCLFPNMLSLCLALDRHTKKNGCLQVIRKSHLLGRLNNYMIGQSSGANPQRVNEILQQLDVVHCELEPGDGVFFHGNTLHGSDVNHSQGNRTGLFASYNAISNQPFPREGQEHHRYRPLIKVDDTVLQNQEYTSIVNAESFLPAETDNNPGPGIVMRSGRTSDRLLSS